MQIFNKALGRSTGKFYPKEEIPLSSSCSSIDPERDLHCGWNIESSGHVKEKNPLVGRKIILADGISVNGKCNAPPLRLTGGVDRSFECEENVSMEYQGNDLIDNMSTFPANSVLQFLS